MPKGFKQNRLLSRGLYRLMSRTYAAAPAGFLTAPTRWHGETPATTRKMRIFYDQFWVQSDGDWLPLASALSYRSVQFSSWLNREESIAAKITKPELIMLNVKNSRSAIIIFVPNLNRVVGCLLSNVHTLNEGNP